MDAGINHIKIVDERTDMRFLLSDACYPFTDPILRDIFLNAGMELLPGMQTIECKKEELFGRYDLSEGIDIILKFKDNTKGTLQQKTLYTTFSTVTFEERKNSGKLGAWYYCTAQYYFVIYTVESDSALRTQLRDGFLNPTMREAVLLNLAEFHKLSLNDKIMWNNNTNQNEGRYNPFKYTRIKDIPSSCIIGEYHLEHSKLPFES